MSDALLVGIGRVDDVLQQFSSRFPNHPGRLILEKIDPSNYEHPAGHSFEVLNHDILDPQPIMGARAYYLRTPMRRAHGAAFETILEQVKLAMVPGYSILLLEELGVSGPDATWTVTSVDRVDNAAQATMSLTKECLERILEQAGFRVRQTYRPRFGLTFLVDLELAV